MRKSCKSLGNLPEPPGFRVILAHSEDASRSALRSRIHERFGLAADMPLYGELIEF